MLKLHPSRIFIAYLVIFITSTAALSLRPACQSFGPLAVVGVVALIISIARKTRIFLFVALASLVLIIASQRVCVFFVSEEGVVDDDGSVVVRIIDEPRVHGKSQSFSVVSEATKMNIGVVTNQFPAYELGQIVEIEGNLQYVTKDSNLYTYHKANNIVANYYYPEISLSEKEQSFFEEYYYKLRQSLVAVRQKYEATIARALPEPQAGLLSGILLGSRADLAQEFKDTLSRTGVIHIVALSGYNITIVAAFMAVLGRHFPKRITFNFSVIGIWGFVLATGLSASVVRAAIMGTLLLVATRFGRRSSGLVSVLFASALMIFINPNILLYDIGFQLSFAAVCGILFLAPSLERLFNFSGGYFGPMLAATFSAQIFTLPLLSYHFERISLVSMLANLLILPFVPLVMLIGFVASSLGLISLWLSGKVLIVVWLILSYFIEVVNYLGSLSVAEANYRMSPLTLLASYIILFEIVMIMRKRRRVKAKNN